MFKLSRLLSLVVTVAIIGGSVLAVVRRYEIADWFRLRNYTPSAQIEALSDKTTMTPYARRLFYVHDPQLLDKQGFNERCDFGEKTIVLGCFDGMGIYLYDVDDPALSGVQEVTAAHEMLHAAYERLSSTERERLTVLLEQALNDTNNIRVRNLVESYRQRDPQVVPNELHSIIGTELREIPDELEEYYKKYFTNRLRVVEYSEKYEAVFVAIQQQVEVLDAQLLLQKSQIERIEAELQRDANNLKENEAELNTLRANNQIAEYNARVNTFNAEVAAYNQKLQLVRNIIAEYNRLVAERNELSYQQNSLIKNLDSKAEEL